MIIQNFDVLFLRMLKGIAAYEAHFNLIALPRLMARESKGTYHSSVS